MNWYKLFLAIGVYLGIVLFSTGLFFLIKFAPGVLGIIILVVISVGVIGAIYAEITKEPEKDGFNMW